MKHTLATPGPGYQEEKWAVECKGSSDTNLLITVAIVFIMDFIIKFNF